MTGIPALAAQQRGAADASHPYIARGRLVETRQRELSDRVRAFHDAFAAVLREVAPDLLPRLEPPPPTATGYQLLPRIVPGAPAPAVPPRPQLVSYSWRWSETLMRNEGDTLTALERTLAAIPRDTSGRARYESLAAAYRRLVGRKRAVDSDVNYNWLWQAEVVRAPLRYERATALHDAIVSRDALRTALPAAIDSARRAGVVLGGGVAARTAADSIVAAQDRFIEEGVTRAILRVDAPAFLQFEQPSPREWLITVPMLTDITDTAFVAQFVRVVEEFWQARTDTLSYRVRVAMNAIAPRELYCPAGAPATCAPPARGAAINLAQHIARFPAGSAVLTTGAGTTHVTAGRAVAIAPFDAPRRLIAHEFGHILGFRDGYLRGFRNLGADGFAITELVVDHSDIMGNLAAGAITPKHFERLIAVKDVHALMQAGLDALFQRNDAATAAARFRDVLARHPEHYGAHVQLARVLDQQGNRAEAGVWWAKVLELAQLATDTALVRQATMRLQQGGQR